MKKLITLVLLIIVVDCTAQTFQSRSIYNVEQFVTDCLNDLQVAGDSIIIRITNFRSTVIKSPCIIRCDANDNMYIIYISNEESYSTYIKILAHELVHVKQFHHNEFKYNKVACYNTDYNKMLNYDKRFEDEANIIGAELIAKHLKITQ